MSTASSASLVRPGQRVLSSPIWRQSSLVSLISCRRSVFSDRLDVQINVHEILFTPNVWQRRLVSLITCRRSVPPALYVQVNESCPLPSCGKAAWSCHLSTASSTSPVLSHLAAKQPGQPHHLSTASSASLARSWSMTDSEESVSSSSILSSSLFLKVSAISLAASVWLLPARGTPFTSRIT